MSPAVTLGAGLTTHTFSFGFDLPSDLHVFSVGAGVRINAKGVGGLSLSVKFPNGTVAQVFDGSVGTFASCSENRFVVVKTVDTPSPLKTKTNTFETCTDDQDEIANPQNGVIALANPLVRAIIAYFIIFLMRIN